MWKKMFVSVLFVCSLGLWMVPDQAIAGSGSTMLSPRGRVSVATPTLKTPVLGQHRLQVKAVRGLWSDAVTAKAGEGGGVQGAFQSIFWGIGVPLMVLDAVMIGGMTHALFSGDNRFAWGALSSVAGGLTILWGFFSFSEGTADAVMFGIPMWALGAVTMILGILTMSVGRHEAKHHSMLPTVRTKKFAAVFAPWMSADRDGKPTGGLMVSGMFQ